MKIIDKETNNILNEYDVNYNLGYLIPDKLLLKHHDKQEHKNAVTHLELIKEYDNGGKDYREVIDEPEIPFVDEYDEYEEISYYVKYTQEELKNVIYPNLVEKYIRIKYSVCSELGILRKREPTEFALYNNYVEECISRAKKELGLG